MSWPVATPGVTVGRGDVDRVRRAWSPRGTTSRAPGRAAGRRHPRAGARRLRSSPSPCTDSPRPRRHLPLHRDRGLPVLDGHERVQQHRDRPADATAPVVTVTSVNGAARSFPYRTNASVTTIGGACGTAAGDSASVTPLLDGSATSPSTATCASGVVDPDPRHGRVGDGTDDRCRPPRSMRRATPAPRRRRP